MVKELAGASLLVILIGFALFQAMGQDKKDTLPGLKVGEKAPDFELVNMEGQTVALSDYKGKKVMVNFWATWCGPCRDEMPAMEKYAAESEEDVVILAINTDPENDVAGFAEGVGITFPVLLDENDKALKKYSVKAMPTTYFIDEKGIIANKHIGEMDYKIMEEAVAGL
ncbi:MAG: peroxiredoxin family protein [Bacillus sp. (in: firmicutes)]